MNRSSVGWTTLDTLMLGMLGLLGLVAWLPGAVQTLLVLLLTLGGFAVLFGWCWSHRSSTPGPHRRSSSE